MLSRSVEQKSIYSKHHGEINFFFFTTQSAVGCNFYYLATVV